MAGGAAAPGQSVVGKVAMILSTFAEGGHATLTDIVRRTGLPMSTAHRLVAEMAAQRLLARDDDGVYRVGLPLRVLGAEPAHGAGPAAGLGERAGAVLSDLVRGTGGSARLGVLDRGEVALALQAGPRAPSSSGGGVRLPAHATAVGKALLAFSPAAVVERVVARGLPRCTASTITAPDLLRRSLAHVRLTRIATSHGEHVPGRNAVAAPVFGPGGRVVAAVELTIRDLPGDLPAVRGALTVAAGTLSRDAALAAAGAWRDGGEVAAAR